jgi:glycosyltransferase 2 family protein
VAWGTSSHARSALRFEARELRAGLGSMRVSLQVATASVVVIACHVTTFIIAAEAVGAKAPPLQLVTLALVVLLGASIPLSVGGWGPREGVAGWAFALAGLGASAGVSASTLFGALTIIAVSPGAVVTVVAAVRRRTATQVVPTIAQAAGGTSVFALASRQQETSP